MVGYSEVELARSPGPNRTRRRFQAGGGLPHAYGKEFTIHRTWNDAASSASTTPFTNWPPT